MARQGLDGFVAPHEDEHQNEYLPAANDRLAWATGFTGSAGAAVILKDKAAVFVDGRYTLQGVRDQVDQAMFEIRDLVDGGVPAYLETAATPGQVMGYDPRLHSPDALDRLKAAVDPRRRRTARGDAQSAGRRLGRGPPGPADRPGRAPSAAIFRRGGQRQAPPHRRKPGGPQRGRRGDHLAGLHRLAVQCARR